MQADLEQRDKRPTQLLERVSRKRNERLKRSSQTEERPANSFVFKGTERRVSPLAVGGKAHQHAAFLPCQRELVVFILAVDGVDADLREAGSDLQDTAAAFAFPGHRTRGSRQFVWNFV